jgi:hypothetical protein
VIGGSSSINAMAYVRGIAPTTTAGLVRPARLGYADVLPTSGGRRAWEGGADAYRGGDGPLTVETSR